MVVTLTFRRDPSRARTSRSLVAVLAASLLSLGLFASGASAHPGACRHADTPIGLAPRAQLQRAVVCLINQQRRAHGVGGLRASAQLDRSAQDWSNAMVVRRDFTHGADFSARISAVGFNWSSVGENIATGYQTPAAVVAAWMASPGHCRNILSPIYREVGTGVNDHAIPGFSSQAGTWTQDFGLLMGQHPASGNWGPADGCPYN